MEDTKYADSFEIISNAGDAKAKAMKAIDFLEEYRFKDAQDTLNEAKKLLVEAHKTQTKLINQEICGESVEMHVLMVHAQDHFSMATEAIELAEKMSKVYRRLYALEEKINQL